MIDAREHGVLLEVAYDGEAFFGWAAQRDVRTVEDVLRGAIVAVDPRAGRPRGVSRTDRGVHAEGQLAAFDAALAIPPRGWVLALNQHLPDDVAVRAARPVPAGYEPRFACRSKRYRYTLFLDRVRCPLRRNRAWRIGYEMDIERLTREARDIVGTHDFAAFRAAGDERVDTTRTILDVAVGRGEDPRVVTITFTGTAFLYNMVRILVGTLVDVGRGQLELGTIAGALEAARAKTTSDLRAMTGQTAPAHGLVLERIEVALPEGTGAAWPP